MTSKKILPLILILSYISLSYSSQLCPTVNPNPNFNLSQFLGTWYEVVVTANPNGNDLSCSWDSYTPGYDGTIRATRNGVDPITNETVTSVGWLKSLDATTPNHFDLFFPASFETMPYSVIETDYANYALVISCDIDGLIERAWILSRQPTLSFAAVIGYMATLQEMGYPSGSMIVVDQLNCNY